MIKYDDIYKGKAAVGSLLENGAETLYTLLEDSVSTDEGNINNTEGLAYVMRYIMHRYNSKDYGVNDFETLAQLLGLGDISSVVDGDLIIKTDEPNAAPVITDLETLKKAFKGYKTNKKLLAEAQTFLDMQEKYKVNAIFAAAVSIVETTAGTAGNGSNGNHNWFNYAHANGTIANTEGHTGDTQFCTWDTDAHGILGFGYYIANGSIGFKVNNYSVKAIGDAGYCTEPPPPHWENEVKGYMKQMYKAAGINISNTTGGDTKKESGDGYTQTFTSNGKTYKEYKQNKGSYKNDKYSNGTISTSGCGPTAVAIVASGYGKDYNPGTLVSAAKKKYGVSNFSASADATKKMIKTAGLKYEETNNLTKDNLSSNLKAGKQVVLSLQGESFSSGSHYLAILAINEKGDKVYVSNPNGKKTGWCSIDSVVKACRGYKKYALFISD